MEASVNGSSELLVSSEVYDDVITALRSQEVPLKTVINFIRDMKAIPHRALPVTLDVALSALGVYREHGGSRRLHYFDSFHVATSQVEGLPLLTSDKYILSHADEFGIQTLDAREV